MPSQMAASMGAVVDGTAAAADGSGDRANVYPQDRQFRASTPTDSAQCGQTLAPQSVLSSSVIGPAYPANHQVMDEA